MKRACSSRKVFGIFCPIATTLGFSRQLVIKASSVKFHEKSSSCSRVDTSGQADRERDGRAGWYTDGRTEGQLDRQTDTHTHTHTHMTKPTMPICVFRDCLWRSLKSFRTGTFQDENRTSHLPIAGHELCIFTCHSGTYLLFPHFNQARAVFGWNFQKTEGLKLFASPARRMDTSLNAGCEHLSFGLETSV